MKLNKIFILLIFGILFLLPSCSSDDLCKQDTVIYGDSRTNHDIHTKVVDKIIKCEPKVVFHTGDLVEDGTDFNQWEIFNGIVSELVSVATFYPVLGNHERESKLYFDNFDLPNNKKWYSLDVDNIHFIVLDSNSDISIDSGQYNWLESDLNSINKNINFTIALFHHPIFSSGRHGSNENLQTILTPLFEKYGVYIVFNGHDHDYERSYYNGIYYIVTGGGGAPLYNKGNSNPYSQIFIKNYHFCGINVSEDQLTVSVFNVNSILIDRFTIVR